MAGKSNEATTSQGQASNTVERAVWTPQPGPQANAICADWCPCIFYGGGKFSGKTDFLLGDYLQDLETYREHWQGIIFRRALTEFTEMKLRASEIFPKVGGVWHQQTNEWRFPKYGTKDMVPTLRFRYLERLQEIRLYEGHSYPFIGVDELGDWESEEAFFRLFTFNRYGRHPIPTKRIRATGNPGGRGHQWIKKYFVDPAPMGSKLLYDETLKTHYMFILGTYRDNKIGMMNDPGYDNRMNRAGSPALVQALKNGDFSVVSGAFFPEFSMKHIIYPHEIPPHWTRYVSMDWGSCGEGDPFSIGWWCVADGAEYEGVPYYKRGHKIRYREWFGKGLGRVTVASVCAGIKERESPTEKISYRLAGGDIKKKADASGPSIFEMFESHGLYWQRADMSRVTGWLKLRENLNDDKNVSSISVFATCVHSIEIIPSVQHSMVDPNDIEPINDDLPDEWRYAQMGREYATDAPEADKPLSEKFYTPTLDDMWQRFDNDRGKRR